MNQESFNTHFAEVNDEGDWEVRLIDQTDNVEQLRKRDPFWQHELDTFQPNGLNEHEVAPFLMLKLKSSFFVMLTHNIYCNRWQWHILPYVF